MTATTYHVLPRVRHYRHDYVLMTLEDLTRSAVFFGGVRRFGRSGLCILELLRRFVERVVDDALQMGKSGLEQEKEVGEETTSTGCTENCL